MAAKLNDDVLPELAIFGHGTSAVEIGEPNSFFGIGPAVTIAAVFNDERGDRLLILRFALGRDEGMFRRGRLTCAFVG